MDAAQRVTQHLNLVPMIARSLAPSLPRHVEVAELEAVGYMGLVEAAGRYDESRAVPFDSFARNRIRGAMFDAMRRNDFGTRSVRRWGRRIEEATTSLVHDLGRVPTSNELAEKLGITVAHLDRLRARTVKASVISLDASLADDDEGATTLGATVADEGTDPVVALLDREQSSLLADAVAALPERLRFILVATYYEGRPLADVATELGVTESRISQLRGEAVEYLRQVMVPSERSTASRRSSRLAAWGEAVTASRTWQERLAVA